MGNFYCNFTTRGPSAEEIVRLLDTENRSAFVSPTLNGRTVIFEEASDELSPDEIDAVGTVLSRELNCPALAAVVADDDELLLVLYESGRRTIEYSSRGANRGAVAISRAFGRIWLAPLVWVLLQWPYLIFESMRHAMLAKLLGIPPWCVASGYRYISEGESPLPEVHLRRTAKVGRRRGTRG
jgi:hypothetical protein